MDEAIPAFISDDAEDDALVRAEWRKVGRVTKWLLRGILYTLIAAIVGMLLWNAILPDVLGWRHITVLQMGGLIILINVPCDWKWVSEAYTKVRSGRLYEHGVSDR